MIEGSKYPKQVAVIKRRLITLGIDANLELPGVFRNSREEEIITPPLSMHGPRSCFKWTLVDKSGAEVVYPFANIPCDEVAVLKTKVNALISHNTVAVTPNSNSEGMKEGLAYSVKIRMREFQGKTPASVLLEDSSKLERLLQTADFLRSQGSNSRYWESNQQQIQAIEEAVALFNNGELSARSADNATGSFTVYYKPQKVLLNRAPKGDRFFTYSFKIECLSGYTYPWQIGIANAYMKIKKKSDGTHETIPGTAVGRTFSQLQISDYEMGYLIERMYNTMINFELVFFRQQYAESIKQHKEMLESLHANEKADKAA